MFDTVAEVRSGSALGTHSRERQGGRSDRLILDEWVHEIHDGDEVAALDAPQEDRFGDAVLAHHQRLVRFAYMLSGSKEIAEASVTETYARLWPRFRRGRIQNVLPYLMREVIVDVRERTRRAGSRRAATVEPGELETPWAALQHLPLEQRGALVLHVVEGLSLDESAMLLDEPVDITAARVTAGMARVAELLVRAGPDA